MNIFSRMNKNDKTLFYLSLPLLALLLAFFARDDISAAGNEASRFAAVQSIVENGTYCIERSGFETVDKALINGRFYSGKPILFTVFLSGIYWILYNVFGLAFETNYHLCVYLVTLLGTGSFSFLLYWLFVRELIRDETPALYAVPLGFCLIFSTWIFSYGVSINNHTPSACMLFLLFSLLRRAGSESSPWLFFTSGLAAGTAAAFTIPIGGIFGIAAMLYLLGMSFRDRAFIRKVLFYIPGFLLPLALAGLFDFIAYGNILPIYLIKGAYDYPGCPHSERLAGLTPPSCFLWYFFHLTLGTRGLFSYMPALIFGLCAFFMKSGKNENRPLKISVALAFTAALLFYSSITENFGGWSYGFRFIIPAIPLLFWYSCKLFLRFRKNVALSILFCFCILAGFVSSYAGAYNPWPVCYEGYISANRVENDFKCTFTANLLCASFEKIPDSRLFKYLSEDVYGREKTHRYLIKAFLNMKKTEAAKRAFKHNNF